jgi:hypothetical protein
MECSVDPWIPQAGARKVCQQALFSGTRRHLRSSTLVIMAGASMFLVYCAILLALAALCSSLPWIGYPLAVLFSLRLLIGGRKRRLPGDEDLLDTEPPDHYDHHH